MAQQSWKQFWAALLVLAGLVCPPTEAGASGPVDVYMLRGFGDVFSRGLDQMAQTLNASGIETEVLSHTAWRSVLRDILETHAQRGPRPVVLIGHSLGANAVIRIAEELKNQRIAVQYMVTLAATAPAPVPSNVRRVDNYYFATKGWGEPLGGGAGFTGRLRNLDFSNAKGVGHFNIDEQAAVQRELVDKIARYARQ